MSVHVGLEEARLKVMWIGVLLVCQEGFQFVFFCHTSPKLLSILRLSSPSYRVSC